MVQLFGKDARNFQLGLPNATRHHRHFAFAFQRQQRAFSDKFELRGKRVCVQHLSRRMRQQKATERFKFAVDLQIYASVGRRIEFELMQIGNRAFARHMRE